jgi:hypothetical protein
VFLALEADQRLAAIRQNLDDLFELSGLEIFRLKNLFERDFLGH